MERLERLLAGVRAIGPGIEIRITPSSVLSDQWSVTVIAGSAILIYTDFDIIENALAEACRKLASISSKMMAAVRRTDPPPASKSESESESESKDEGGEEKR
jgi:hypothetical protein